MLAESEEKNSKIEKAQNQFRFQLRFQNYRYNEPPQRLQAVLVFK